MMLIGTLGEDEKRTHAFPAYRKAVNGEVADEI